MTKRSGLRGLETERKNKATLRRGNRKKELSPKVLRDQVEEKKDKDRVEKKNHGSVIHTEGRI